MVMPIAVPRYNIEDLESFPDDGNRYELLDGILLVSPARSPTTSWCCSDSAMS